VEPFWVAYLTVMVATLGLVVGSFLNVVIARVPLNLSVVRPRSRCPKCGHQLAWYENVPVVSWVMLRGKCKGCKAPISPRYVFVELMTGALYLACLNRFGFSWPLVSALVFVTLIVPLVFIDAEHWILPLEIMGPGTLAGVLLAWPSSTWQSALMGAMAGYLVFRALEWFGWVALRKEALGAGDKFLVAMIGAFVGWRPLLGLVVLASLQAAIWGIGAMALTGRAGPAGPKQGEKETPDEEAEEPQRSFNPSFLAPGLPWWKRLLLLPVTLLWQEIPDPLLGSDEAGNEVDLWQPGATNLPFGPWLGLAGLQVLLWGPWLAGAFADSAWGPMLEVMFGGGS
jgi:leader peptidase (prepilin peptidase) / N-methyltransferase